MSNRIYAAIVLIGAGTSAALAFINPTVAGAAMATTGGVLTGISLGDERRRREREANMEADMVAQTFRNLYEKNRGVISPDELSLMSAQPKDRINRFLVGLAAQNDGKQIQVQEGVVYSFPHPDNVLDKLTANSQAWANAQIQPIAEENQKLKQALVILQNQIAAGATQQAAIPQPPRPPKFVPQPSVPPQQNFDEPEQTDPWKNLL